MNEQSIIEKIAQFVEAKNPPEENDYYDNEGFLICGNCNHPREKLMSGWERKVRVLCPCRNEQREKEEEEKRNEDAIRAISRLRKQSLMDEKFYSSTFESFHENTENAKNLKLCKRYAYHFDEMVEKAQGLIMVGGIGTGKTFSAACIANHLIEQKTPVIMTSFVRLLDSMQSFKEQDETMISRLNKAKLLIIDDLGAERGTDFALEKVYSIIDSRYRKRLPLILTTNNSITTIKNETDIRYARIYDRIFEMCYPMQFTGFSWRKSQAVKREQEMRAFLEG